MTTFRGGFAIRGAAQSGPLFSTTFPESNQNPLSQGGGRWLNGADVGLDWGNMQIVGNKAVGTIAVHTHDNTAILTGISFNNNQYGQGLLWRGSPDVGDPGPFPESEIRLRSNISANVCTGYEFGWGLRGGTDSYIFIVRWNGPVGEFTELASIHDSSVAVSDGDLLYAQIVGNIASMYTNGNLVLSADITTAPTNPFGPDVYTSGSPGIGSNCDPPNTTIAQWGFRSFSASNL